MDINIFDFILLAIVIWYAARGYRIGFFGELIGIAGVAIAMAIALRAIVPAAPFFGRMLNMSAGVSVIVIFFLVYLIILIALKYFESFIRRHADLKFADALNRAFGSVIGLCKGALIASLLAVFITGLPLMDSIRNYTQASKLRSTFAGIAPHFYDALRTFIPGDKKFATYWQDTVNQFKREQVDSDITKLLWDLNTDKTAPKQQDGTQ